jgi:hypothetical protein
MGPFTIGGKFAAANFKKSSEAPVEPIFQVLRAFFDGVFEKLGCWTWFFDGEFVVRCVVKRGEKDGCFSVRKTFTFCRFILRVGPGAVQS